MTRYPWRDLALLLTAALVARVLAAWLVPSAPYTDAAYYTMVAQRLADGFGFTVPVLYSFLEVGGALPAAPGLPVDSNGHWMPLTSVVSGGFMTLLGSSDWRAGQVPMVLLSVAWVGITHGVTWDLWRNRGWALVAGVARHLRRAASRHAAAARLVRPLRRARLPRAVGLDARRALGSPVGLVARRVRRAHRPGHAHPRRRPLAGGSPGRCLVGAAAIGLAAGGPLDRACVRARLPRRHGAMADPQRRGLRCAAPVGRRPHPVDHLIQRAVLHRPRGLAARVPRLGSAAHRRLEAGGHR